MSDEIQGAEHEKPPKLPSFLNDSETRASINAALASTDTTPTKKKKAAKSTASPSGPSSSTSGQSTAALRRGKASKQLSTSNVIPPSPSDPAISATTSITAPISTAGSAFVVQARQLALDARPNNIYAYGFVGGVLVSLLASFVVSFDVENYIGTILSVGLFFDLISSSLIATGKVRRPYVVSIVYIVVFVVLWAFVAFIQFNTRKQPKNDGILSLFSSKQSQFDWTTFHDELHSLNFVIVVVSSVLVGIRLYLENKAGATTTSTSTSRTEKKND